MVELDVGVCYPKFNSKYFKNCLVLGTMFTPAFKDVTRPHIHELLVSDGWKVSNNYFWEETPCFYDLGSVKTVILFQAENTDPKSTRQYEKIYYWKHEAHELPTYLDANTVEIRHYKLHHSMNALLWHDHGDRPLWPA